MAVASEYESFLSTTRAVADPLRADILRALRHDSFGVLELARIFDVAQPALSHHLKILSRAGLVATRRDGNGIYYRRAQPRPGALFDYLSNLYATLDAFDLDAKLERRMYEIHAERAARSRKFFADHALRFAHQRELICVPETYLPALRESIEAARCSRRRALDVGPGDGETLLVLAEYFDAVLGIDNSPEMLDRARASVAAGSNGSKISLRLKPFEDFKAPRQDLVLFAMVLHHAASPRRFFEHAERLLNDSGALIVVELVTHDQEWAKTACGDLWLGFDAAELDEWASAVGLVSTTNQYLAQRNGFRIQIRTYQKGAQQ